MKPLRTVSKKKGKTTQQHNNRTKAHCFVLLYITSHIHTAKRWYKQQEKIWENKSKHTHNNNTHYKPFCAK